MSANKKNINSFMCIYAVVILYHLPIWFSKTASDIMNIKMLSERKRIAENLEIYIFQDLELFMCAVFRYNVCKAL